MKTTTSMEQAALDQEGALRLEARWGAVELWGTPQVPIRTVDEVLVLEMPDHWHYVTVGLPARDLERDNPRRPLIELTMRVSSRELVTEKWPAKLLWNIAGLRADQLPVTEGYSFPLTSFIPYFPEIDHVVLADDPAWTAPVETEHGPVRPLQLIGVLEEEADAIRSWNALGVLRLLATQNQRWLTCLRRDPITDDPAIKVQIDAGAARDGAATDALDLLGLEWEDDPLDPALAPTLFVPRAQLSQLADLLRGRLGRGRDLLLTNLREGTNRVWLRAGEDAWRRDSDWALTIHVAPRTAALIADELERGLDQVAAPGLPRLQVYG